MKKNKNKSALAAFMEQVDEAQVVAKPAHGAHRSDNKKPRSDQDALHKNRQYRDNLKK